MYQSPEQLISTMRAAGEPNRLRILALLSRGALSVGELVQIMGQSQPRLSHHLKALAMAGLVERHPEGSWVFYSLAPGGPERDFADMILSLVSMETDDFARDDVNLKRVRTERASAADAYFSEVAETWDTIRSLHFPNEAIEAALLDLAGNGPFDRVIDIGTGTGRMLALFAPRTRRADGLDLSHRMLTVARANLDAAGITNAHVRQGDAAMLPYETGAADLVIVHQVLHFIDAPERVLAEAARVLAPEGRLLIVDFAPHALEFLREAHGHRWLGIRHETLREWAGSAGLDLLAPHHFEPPEALAEGLAVNIWRAVPALAAREAAE